MVDMADERFLDLYLWIIPDSNTLYKLGHLTKEQADTCAQQWFDISEIHDYMYVREGLTPWSTPAPTIIEKSPEWIFMQDKEINGDI